MLCGPRNIRGLLISNVAFPKYIEEEIAVKGKDCRLILPYLLKSIKQLERAGADFIVMPCNTLHVLLPILRKETKLEVLDLIEEVKKELRQYKKVAILCTTKTRQEKLYDNVIYPTEQEQKKVSEIIIRIIRKQHTEEDKQYLLHLIEKLINDGAEKVVLACTDLANLVDHKQAIDTAKILIESIQRKMGD